MIGVRRAVALSLVLILLQFMIGIYLYPRMPERMAVHWGPTGEADGYGSRFTALLLIPLTSALMYPFFMALPRLDPAGGIKQFQGAYDWFTSGFVGFMSYLYGLTVLWNLGWRFSMTRLLTPALGVLYIGIGFMLDKARFNWFVGIRTPWTMSSVEVWDKTHRLGGRMFKVCGLLGLLGVFFQGWVALTLMIGPILLGSLYLVYYSYREHVKLGKETHA